MHGCQMSEGGCVVFGAPRDRRSFPIMPTIICHQEHPPETMRRYCRTIGSLVTSYGLLEAASNTPPCRESYAVAPIALPAANKLL